MKNVLFVFLIFCFIITIISCGEDKEESTTDTTSGESTTDTTSNDLKKMGGSMQGVELGLSTLVSTQAGTGSSGSANGTGTSASFKGLAGITTDGTNLYVADAENHLIRQIEQLNIVTTISGVSGQVE